MIKPKHDQGVLGRGMTVIIPPNNSLQWTGLAALTNRGPKAELSQAYISRNAIIAWPLSSAPMGRLGRKIAA